MKREIRTTMLMPAYMQAFHCIGSECADHCCTMAWKITLDRDTFQTYRASQDSELQPVFMHALKRNRKAASDADYGQIVPQPGASDCPMMDGGLCKVHARLGAAALSDTCFTYPRTTTHFNGVLSQAAALSCPEAARLALSSADAMQWVEYEGVVRESACLPVYGQAAAAAQQLLQEVHHTCLRVLSAPELELWQALALLAILCHELAPLQVQHYPVERTAQVLEAFTAMLESGALNASLAAVQPDLDAQAILLGHTLLNGRSLHRAGRHPRFADVLVRFSSALGETPAEVGKRYPEAALRWRAQVADAGLEYVLRNYVLNLAFREVFPVQGKPGDKLAALVSALVAVRGLCIGLAEEAGAVSLEDMQLAVQSFERVCQHDSTFIGKLAATFSRAGLHAMPRLWPLLRL
ncbi:hypothetical protein EHS17_12780 [Rhodobacteraceae bacterium CH30]|nr:hypothetical protein EHS17_12780 [Rhodobacteraceae bacterium CH30]